MSQRLFMFLAYLITGLGGIGFAAFLASHWVAPSRSQEVGAPQPPAEVAVSSQADVKPSSGTVVTPREPQAELSAETQQLSDEVNNIMQPFLYQGEGRRDPFEPYQDKSLAANDEESQLPAAPLEAYNLDDVELVGVIWDVKSPKAMFADPKKNVHILGKDDRIGRNSGYIAVIREGEVVVVETIKNRGEVAYATRVMKIVR